MVDGDWRAEGSVSFYVLFLVEFVHDVGGFKNWVFHYSRYSPIIEMAHKFWPVFPTTLLLLLDNINCDLRYLGFYLNRTLQLIFGLTLHPQVMFSPCIIEPMSRRQLILRFQNGAILLYRVEGSWLEATFISFEAGPIDKFTHLLPLTTSNYYYT